MKKVLLLLLLAPVSAMAQSGQLVVTHGSVGMITNIYCDDGTNKWGERGPACQADASKRQSVTCAYTDPDGTIVPDPAVKKCQVPAGWESAPTKWQTPH